MRRFVKEAIGTPLDRLMKAMIEQGTPKLEEQIDLSWEGVAYSVQRLSLSGRTIWRSLLHGIKIPNYCDLESDGVSTTTCCDFEQSSLAYEIFSSLWKDLTDDFLLLDIALDEPHGIIKLRHFEDIQTATLNAKMFIEMYKKYRTGIESGLNLIRDTSIRDFGCDVEDYKCSINQKLREKMCLDFLVSGYRDSGTFRGISYTTQYDGGRQHKKDGLLVDEAVKWKIILTGIPVDTNPKDRYMPPQGPECRHLEELFKGMGDAVYFIARHETTKRMRCPYIDILVPYPLDIKPFSKAVGSTAHLAVKTAEAAIQRYMDNTHHII